MKRRPPSRRSRPHAGDREARTNYVGDLLAILDTLKNKGRVQEARQVLILARSVYKAIARQRIKRNPASDIPMKMIGAAVSGTER